MRVARVFIATAEEGDAGTATLTLRPLFLPALRSREIITPMPWQSLTIEFTARWSGGDGLQITPDPINEFFRSIALPPGAEASGRAFHELEEQLRAAGAGKLIGERMIVTVQATQPIELLLRTMTAIDRVEPVPDSPLPLWLTMPTLPSAVPDADAEAEHGVALPLKPGRNVYSAFRVRGPIRVRTNTAGVPVAPPPPMESWESWRPVGLQREER
ncbi:MAG: hypothetical protein AB7K09_15855 [Planctomycetota bacterium]